MKIGSKQEGGRDKVPIYEIDLSGAWDTQSQAQIFLDGLKSLGIYDPDLRFSGFDSSTMGGTMDSVFCSTEKDLFSGEGGNDENALMYAFRNDDPVVAVYDGLKLKSRPEGGGYKYLISDKSALIAYIKLKD